MGKIERIRINDDSKAVFYEARVTEAGEILKLFRGRYLNSTDKEEVILEEIEVYALPAEIAFKLQESGVEV